MFIVSLKEKKREGERESVVRIDIQASVGTILIFHEDQKWTFESDVGEAEEKTFRFLFLK